MPKTQLRIATDHDLNFVRRCANAAYSIYVERIGRKPAPMVADFKSALDAGNLQIIIVNAEPIGFVVSFARGNNLFVENVALHPVHQGKGHASKLFAHLESTARQNSLVAIELYTNEKMTENLPFYARLGFEITDRRHEDGFDRIYFTKRL